MSRERDMDAFHIYRAIDSICIAATILGLLAYMAFIRWLDIKHRSKK